MEDASSFVVTLREGRALRVSRTSGTPSAVAAAARRRLPLVAALAACAATAGARAQEVPGLEPFDGSARIFAEGVISTGDASCPSFTPDGRTVYFMREGGGSYGIWVARHDGRVWSSPVLAPFSGEYPDIDPFVTPDGSRVLFSSRRPGPEGGAAPVTFQPWAVPLTQDGAAAMEPEPFGPRDPAVSRFYLTTARDGTLYFSNRRPDGATGNDVYRSRPVGSGWSEPEPVVELNTEHSDSNPYIAPDGSFIIFFSARPGGAGAADLYISHRHGAGWTAPRNLGPLVNTEDVEICPMLSPDGEHLFFSRDRRADDGTILWRRIYHLPLAAVLER